MQSIKSLAFLPRPPSKDTLLALAENSFMCCGSPAVYMNIPHHVLRLYYFSVRGTIYNNRPTVGKIDRAIQEGPSLFGVYYWFLATRATFWPRRTSVFKHNACWMLDVNSCRSQQYWNACSHCTIALSFPEPSFPPTSCRATSTWFQGTWFIVQKT